MAIVAGTVAVNEDAESTLSGSGLAKALAAAERDTIIEIYAEHAANGVAASGKHEAIVRAATKAQAMADAIEAADA